MKLKNNYKILIIVSLILFVSLINNYNARIISDVYTLNFIKQFIFSIIGFFIIFFISKLNIKKVFEKHLIIYLFSCLLLVLVLFFGKNINGATAWFDFGFISFQPSELMKISLTISLVSITNNFNKLKNKSDIVYFISMVILTLIPSLLVFIEPDTGAVIFYALIFLVCILSSKINKKYLYICFLTGISLIISFIYLYIFETDMLINLIGTSFFYRVDRILNISDNYQINNALTLIGSSKLINYNVLTDVLYVPELPTDFAFAYTFGVIGILGGVSVLMLYFILDILLINGSKKANNKLFANVFVTLFIFQQFYNIFMNIGLVPIMGIPLPFLSYGGSSLLIYFIFLGIYLKDTVYLNTG